MKKGNLYIFKAFTFIVLAAALFTACGTATQQEQDSGSMSEETEEAPDELSQLEKEHQLYRAGYSDSVNSGLIEEDQFVSSPRRETSGVVGDTEVTVNYGSPGKRGRVIWNGLVSYDQIWVSGSHWATAVTFSNDVKIQDVTVPAGMYAYFTIPGREDWTLILNERYDQHLSDDYSEEEDILRMTVTPTILDEVVQRLKYEIREIDETHGEIIMSWDQIQVAMPFEVL